MDTKHIRLFCPNDQCPDYRKLQSDEQQNVRRMGHTGRGKVYYRCTSCGQPFTSDNLLWLLHRRRSG